MSGDTRLTVELAYNVEKFEPGRFLVMALFKTTDPGITTMGHGDVDQPILVRPSGVVELSYPMLAVWDDKNVKRPFEVKFCINQLIGTLDGSVSVACTEPIAFPPAVRPPR